MSKFLGILVLLALGYGIYALVNHYKTFEENPATGAVTTPPGGPDASAPQEDVPTDSLAGLPPNLEPTLKAAYEKGAAGLAVWLKTYRRYVADPRLAGVELDYCVLLLRSDPQQAAAMFNTVKRRVSPDSPLYHRVRRMESLFP
jgi:hypothetical protein